MRAAEMSLNVPAFEEAISGNQTPSLYSWSNVLKSKKSDSLDKSNEKTKTQM